MNTAQQSPLAAVRAERVLHRQPSPAPIIRASAQPSSVRRRGKQTRELGMQAGFQYVVLRFSAQAIGLTGEGATTAQGRRSAPGPHGFKHGTLRVAAAKIQAAVDSSLELTRSAFVVERAPLGG